VPTTLSPDGRSRPPHLRTWRDGWRHLRFLLLFSPRWLFLYPGAAIFVIGLLLSLLLLPGPVAVAPHVVLDVHSLIVSCFAMLVGAQCLCFGIVARRYAAARGFLPAKPALDRWGPWLTLERALAGAGIVLVAGLAGLVYCVVAWASVDFGAINYPSIFRILTVSSTLVALALQVAFTAFLSAIFDAA
jgi:hypothetical protein